MEKVVFGFFVVLSATLNLGFFVGDMGNPELHNAYELYAALVVNLITLVLKFGDRTQMGAMHLATSLVAVIQLAAATAVYVWGTQASNHGFTTGLVSSVVSLSGGALMANVVSVILMVIETASYRRR